ncbi:MULTISPECIES: ethanolamine utilization protein EutH [unclassified Cetobacterium]|uniref:ethanolamine utilization protein EutH n=1 Tax=unclassified Cetobacterium TaxID=2630983 RepID=UPI0006471C69|nr:MULTISPECIES: ethanolamine utilization protein EutH [unclassified Cetobacterium]
MKVIFFILTFFAVLGAIDRCFGNKLGYGQRFQDGICVAGPLMLAMLGILSISPLISKFSKPFVELLYSLTGVDPSIYINSILATDMGGYFLAQDLAIDKSLADFSGVILGSMLGTVVIFTMPVAFGIIDNDSKNSFSKGILSGVATIPLGCLVAGVMMGLNLSLVIYNLIPVVLFSVAICSGLWFYPEKTCNIFDKFGKLMTLLVTVGLTLTLIETMFGYSIVDGLNPIDESMKIVTRVSLTLSGAYPFLYFIEKYCKTGLKTLGGILGIDESGTAGFMASLVSSIPMFGIFGKMDNNSKIINSAFAVAGSYVFGGQLGFVAGVSPENILPFIVAKLVSGFAAIYLAKTMFINKKERNNSFVLNKGLKIN